MGCGSSASNSETGIGGGGSAPDDSTKVDPGKPPPCVIVWGAEGLPNTVVRVGLYCVVRVGLQGSAWAEKSRGLGRMSHPITDIDTAKPEWKFGFALSDLRNVEKQEVHVRVFDRTLASLDDAFIGETTASLDSLPRDKRGEFALVAREKEVGKISMSANLTDFKLTASAMYSKPIGGLKSVSAKDITGDFPLRSGTAPLPVSLRGIFWLTDQESSALVTFGGPSCSGNKIDVRVCGEGRTCAFDESFMMKNMETADPIYHFNFDDGKSPTRCKIYLEFRNLGINLTAEQILKFQMLDCEMELMVDQHPEFPGSICWKRTSEGTSHEYTWVQIFDENKQKLEPAFSKFVEYQNLPKHNEPGKISYHEGPSG